MIVDEAEINFGCAALYGRMAARPRRQVVFLVMPVKFSFQIFLDFDRPVFGS